MDKYINPNKTGLHILKSAKYPEQRLTLLMSKNLFESDQ